MWLTTQKNLNLNLTQPVYLNYDTILENIKNGSRILDWQALIEIWQGKMLNIGNKHLSKYITGVGCANLNNATTPDFRYELALPTTI